MTLDRTIPPEIRKIERLSIAEPQRTSLRNGIPLNIINVGTEDVIRLDLIVKGGAWNQSYPLQAMFTNRMLREGTASLTSRQIAEKLDYYGAWLDLSSSVTRGFVSLYTLRKYFAQTVGILAQMVKEPTFPEQELSVISDVNKQQYLVNSGRVDVMARKQFNRALFGAEHPLGRYVELQDYDAVNSEMLKAFYRKYYHSGNCSLYVSGKVTPDVIQCIEQHFGNAPWGDTSNEETQFPHFPIQTDTRRDIFIEKADALQSSIKVGELSLDQKHPDFQKLKVAVTLLGGYFGSRLMSNIREEKGYTYGIGACLINYPGIGVLGISTEADNTYVRPILSEINREIEILQNEPVSEKELEMVRNYMLGEFCRSYENAFSLADAWIFVETCGLESSFFDNSLRAIMEVSSEDILRLSQTYFCKESLIAVVAGKKM